MWRAGSAGGLLLVAGILLYVTGVGVSGTRHDAHDLLTGSNTSPPQHNIPYGTINLGIAYGTTSKQVLRQLGTPTEKHPGCWVYRGRVGTIRGRYSGPWVDAMKFCFSEGPAGSKAVTQIQSHRVSHEMAHTRSRVRIPAFWGWPMNREPVPDWYLQQNN